MEITSKQLDHMRRTATQLLNLADELDQTEIAVPPEILQMVADKEEKRICLACDRPIADGENVRRGLDSACYATTNARIRKGVVLERELIMAGKIDATRKLGGRTAKMDVRPNVQNILDAQISGKKKK